MTIERLKFSNKFDSILSFWLGFIFLTWFLFSVLKTMYLLFYLKSFETFCATPVVWIFSEKIVEFFLESVELKLEFAFRLVSFERPPEVDLVFVQPQFECPPTLLPPDFRNKFANTQKVFGNRTGNVNWNHFKYILLILFLNLLNGHFYLFLFISFLF